MRASVFDVYKCFIGKMCKHCPEVFDKDNPKPLCIGVNKQVEQATGLPRNIVKACLSVWVNRVEYLDAVIYGDYRYNSKGFPVGCISHEDKCFSQFLRKKKAYKRLRLRKTPTTIKV